MIQCFTLIHNLFGGAKGSFGITEGSIPLFIASDKIWADIHKSNALAMSRAVLACRVCFVSFVKRGASGLGYCFFSLSVNKKTCLTFGN